MKTEKASKTPKADKPEKNWNKGEMRFVPLANIVEHEDVHNRPINKEHVELLKESIMREPHGLDTPLLLWNGGDPDQMVALKKGAEPIPATFLVAGGHRVKALRAYAKEDKEGFEKKFPKGIPAHMIGGTLEDVLAAQLRENLARENPDAAEILPFVLRLKDEFKMKGKKIAKRIGRSDAWVSDVLSIRENLGSDATDEIIKGNVGITDALKASKKVKKGKATKEEALEEAKEKGAKKKKKGSKKADKRFSAKALFARYKALPGLKIGQRLEILEAALEYIVGDSDEVPELLNAADDDESDTKKGKKDKKSKKDKKKSKK